ncbi:hypothetical protein J437_LFUL009314 [Ladona fulva]|uniref:rRNA biogenesis protein RRP36 n=1 Tax=Ladona fulva TaxID=123851 RepID=A0A8K0K571_LADFU|nr:hypothetical protein J437_LFUL009314 [Ladona fulva]
MTLSFGIRLFQTSIREELSQMSFEELQKLKEKLGAKVYNEAMFGKNKIKDKAFKRRNKNRPREMSSKVPIPIVPKQSVFKEKFRDPRFDSLCGKFNEKAFKSAYRFVNDIREKEKNQLKKMLHKETDPDEQENMKYLLKRMENQEREEKMKEEKELVLREERETRIKMLKQGKLPKFKSKAEQKLNILVDRYEKLKKSGKLQKHIEKQRIKNKRKDQKKLREMM